MPLNPKAINAVLGIRPVKKDESDERSKKSVALKYPNFFTNLPQSSAPSSSQVDRSRYNPLYELWDADSDQKSKPPKPSRPGSREYAFEQEAFKHVFKHDSNESKIHGNEIENMRSKLNKVSHSHFYNDILSNKSHSNDKSVFDDYLTKISEPMSKPSLPPPFAPPPLPHPPTSPPVNHPHINFSAAKAKFMGVTGDDDNVPSHQDNIDNIKNIITGNKNRINDFDKSKLSIIKPKEYSSRSRSKSNDFLNNGDDKYHPQNYDNKNNNNNFNNINKNKTFDKPLPPTKPPNLKPEKPPKPSRLNNINNNNLHYSRSSDNINNNNNNNNNKNKPPRPLQGPKLSPKPQGPRGVALYEYASDHPGDLNFKVGDVIMLEEKESDTWYKGHLYKDVNPGGMFGTTGGKRSGIFPANYIEVIEALSSFKYNNGGDNDTTAENNNNNKNNNYYNKTKNNYGFEDDTHAQNFHGHSNDSVPTANLIDISSAGLEDTNSSLSALVLYEFDGLVENGELKLMVGDRIEEVEMVNDDWMRGRVVGGASGMFPASFVEVLTNEKTAAMTTSGFPVTKNTTATDVISPATQRVSIATATALYDFHGQQEGDLSFRAGQVIEVINRINDDWLEGRLDGLTGVFPANFVSNS